MTSLSRPIRVAAQLHPQHGDYSSIRSAVSSAEDLGYDIAYTWDHFFPLYGEREGEHFECWTMLAAWAEQTTRIEIGPLVACNSYRNPELLADMARTTDHIAGGRVILGVGSGWNRRDYVEYGYEFGTAGSRLDDLARSMPRVRDRLGKLNPAPKRDIPILVAGTGEKKTLRIVAEHADSWHAAFPDTPEELEPKVYALRRWCVEFDRDPHDIEWGVGVEPDDLDRFLAEDTRRYVEMGFTQFTLGFNGPRWDVSRGGPWLEWRDEVNA